MILKSKHPAQRHEARFAHQLYTALRRKNELRRSVDLKTWEKPFKELLRDYSPDEIETVLTWYASHIGEKFVPCACAAKTFAAKFDDIRRAMDRDPLSKIISVKIPEESQGMIDRLLDLGWSGPAAQQLPSVAQLSMTAYADFKQSLRDYHDSGNLSPLCWRESERPFRFAIHLEEHLADPLGYIEGWMTEVHGFTKTRRYRGDLFQFVFDPDMEDHATYFREVAAEFCEDPGEWDRLSTTLKKLKKGGVDE